MMKTGFAQTAIWSAAAVLFVLHQDYWWWDNRKLLFGFLPIGLAYHMFFSLASATLWALAVRCAWPTHIEEFAQGKDLKPPPPPSP